MQLNAPQSSAAQWVSVFARLVRFSLQAQSNHSRPTQARCLTGQSTGLPPAAGYLHVRLQMKSSRTVALPALLVQKVGPPLVRITGSFGSRKALSAGWQRGVFGGVPAKVRCSPGAHAEAPCTIHAPLGQSVGQPLAFKGGNLGAREASGACRLRGRYSASRPAASRAVACLPPNPSINRTCPGRPGHAGYLQR
jgi:hypothetical protein